MSDEDRIADRCPACGHQTLFIGAGGWLTCSWISCAEPALTRAIEQARGKAVAEAIAAEREACARTVEGCGLQAGFFRESAAAAIRNRAFIHTVKLAVTRANGCVETYFIDGQVPGRIDFPPGLSFQAGDSYVITPAAEGEASA